jgi:hypothetical protein
MIAAEIASKYKGKKTNQETLLIFDFASEAKDGKPGLRLHYHANCYASFVVNPGRYRIEAVCPQ